MAASATAPVTDAATTVVAGHTTPSPSEAPPTAAHPSQTALASFTASTSGPLAPADVPYTWRPGCPVGPSQLREIRLSYLGFDGRAHTGTIVVNAAVTGTVVGVFRALYRARFPIRRMEPVDAFHGSDPRSMAADNTSGFNCRLAVSGGTPSWSIHAYGDAIDVNTVDNLYLQPGQPVQPSAGAALHRPGAPPARNGLSGGAPVDAFVAAGWGWGGQLGRRSRLPALLDQRALARLMPWRHRSRLHGSGETPRRRAGGGGDRHGGDIFIPTTITPPGGRLDTGAVSEQDTLDRRSGPFGSAKSTKASVFALSGGMAQRPMVARAMKLLSRQDDAEDAGCFIINPA